MIILSLLSVDVDLLYTAKDWNELDLPSWLISYNLFKVF